MYNDLLSHVVSCILSIHVLINDLYYTHSGEHYVFMKGVIGFMTVIDVTGVDLFVMMVSDLMKCTFRTIAPLNKQKCKLC